MNGERRKYMVPELAVLALLAAGMAFSMFGLWNQGRATRLRIAELGRLAGEGPHAAEPVDLRTLEAAIEQVGAGGAPPAGLRGLFTSELRVVAVGSAYPIPFEAETCPYTGMPQPALNQLDRDGDGMTDDWETRYGLDPYLPGDAATDRDGDGFSNREEFAAGSDPLRAQSHPPYATKLRFMERKNAPFPLVFQGATELPGGRQVFQVNTPADGKTHFAALGEEVEGVVIEDFVRGSEHPGGALSVRRGSTRITLPRGGSVPDPESQAELINILDRSRVMATMGALLSLNNDEYTVLGVYADKVVVRDCRTGEVFDIAGVTEEERISLLGGLD